MCYTNIFSSTLVTQCVSVSCNPTDTTSSIIFTLLEILVVTGSAPTSLHLVPSYNPMTIKHYESRT